MRQIQNEGCVLGREGPLLWLGHQQAGVLSPSWQEPLRAFVGAGGDRMSSNYRSRYISKTKWSVLYLVDMTHGCVSIYSVNDQIYMNSYTDTCLWKM